MLKLFILSGAQIGDSHVLRGGEKIGRSPECAVRLNDRSVSRKHAIVEREGDRWMLCDLGSRNGIFSAGQRLPEIELVDGIEVTVGEVELRFRLDSPSAAAPRETPAPRPAVSRPTPPPAVPEPDLEDEFVLEDDEGIEEAFTEVAREATRRAPTTPPTPEESLGETRVRKPAFETRLKGAEERRLEILSQGASGGGFLGGDLSQRPGWVQFLVVIGALAFFAAVATGAWWAVTTLRSG